MPQVMVLNDGETYTSLHGCMIVDIPETIENDNIESFLKLMDADDPRVVTTFIIPGNKDPEGDTGHCRTSNA